MANPIFKKLQKTYKLTFAKGKGNKKVVVPAKFNKDGKPTPVKFDKFNGKLQIEKAFDYWINQVYDSPASFRNRSDRYTDLDFMYYNSPVASTAIDLLADETIQIDSDSEALILQSGNKAFVKEATEFLEKISLNNKQRLRSISFDLSLYGDSMGINSISVKNGISNITPISVYNVKDRLEFSLARATEEYIKKTGNVYNLVSKNKALSDLYDMFKDASEEDIAYMFEEYLFGYRISGDMVLPPWNIVHFRRYSNRSEFFPFGQPAFMHMIAPFRQFNATLNLQALARISSFPLKHFEVETDENMTQIEKFAATNEARQEWANLGVINTGKDEFSINDEIWTPKDTISMNILENRIDIDKIGDLELLQDRMLLASHVPKGYIPIKNDNSWGDSGKALVQQSKIYARYVYTNQQAICSGIADLIKLHFTLLGKYEDEEFIISMPFPVVEESSDRQRLKSDSIRLAKDILDNFGQALGLDRGESLPIDIVEDVFSEYSFLDQEEVSKWVKTYLKAKEENELEEHNRVNKIRKRYYETKETLNSKIWKETLDNNKKIREGVKNGRHYIYSKVYDDKQTKTIRETLRNQRKTDRLQEIIEDDSFKKLNLRELKTIPVKNKKRKFTKM